jgi:hypothetical protein
MFKVGCRASAIAGNSKSPTTEAAILAIDAPYQVRYPSGTADVAPVVPPAEIREWGTSLAKKDARPGDQIKNLRPKE